VSTTLREARVVAVEVQQNVAPARPRRWPDSTPPPILGPRSLDEVAAEIELKQLSRAQAAAKRTLDIVGSVIGLVLLAPIFMIVALLVRLTSRGPALFVQERCGLGGRVFKFYKFRTMVADAEARKAELAHLNEMSGPVFKIARDPRITPVGAFLRKSSLDELPQLWNVLKGDMSLVGPRPPLPDEVRQYNACQAQRLSVIPGITGLWQVSGRSSLPSFDNWLALDLEYANRQSLKLDLQILLKTVAVVVLAKGAQ
jgi:exopolysaccharide biosynthesis polyprenyl glycosylphosphotransferase